MSNLEPSLTIAKGRRGCRPGHLRCICGREQLAIWSAEHGTARCDCGRWWKLAKPYARPGVYHFIGNPWFGRLNEPLP